MINMDEVHSTANDVSDALESLRQMKAVVNYINHKDVEPYMDKSDDSMERLREIDDTMGTHYILSEDGEPEPTTFSKSCEWRRDNPFKRFIKQTCVEDMISGNKYIVSTIFMTMDHSFGASEPLCFETMVFRAEDDAPTGDISLIDGDEMPVYSWAEVWMSRATTMDDILEDHESACNLAKVGALVDGVDMEWD